MLQQKEGTSTLPPAWELPRLSNSFSNIADVMACITPRGTYRSMYHIGIKDVYYCTGYFALKQVDTLIS